MHLQFFSIYIVPHREDFLAPDEHHIRSWNWLIKEKRILTSSLILLHCFECTPLYLNLQEKRKTIQLSTPQKCERNGSRLSRMEHETQFCLNAVSILIPTEHIVFTIQSRFFRFKVSNQNLRSHINLQRSMLKCFTCVSIMDTYI